MKKIIFGLSLMFGLAACSQDTTAPRESGSDMFSDATDLAYDASFAGDPMVRLIPLVLRLPDHLKLSAAQETQIRALVNNFETNTRADRQALIAVLEQARQARQAGKSAEEIRTILQQGEPNRLHIVAAEQKLRTDLLAVLTADQKAWIEAGQPRRCDAAALSESQRTEISALFAAFQQNNAADLDAIKSTLEQAHAAQRNGASRAEVHAILLTAQPAMERVRAAQFRLSVAVVAVLTPAQLASGCYLPHLRGT